MTRERLLGCVLLAAAGLLTAAVFSQQDRPATKPGDEQHATSEPAADAESQIEMLLRYAMPSKQHRLLDRMAGTWMTKTTYWLGPNTPPVESEGTAERKWILDGRFLIEEFDGGNLALPFRGVGIYGYDPFEQKYTSAWVDSLNTSIMTNLGIYDEAKDVVNFTGRYGNPWTGKKTNSRGLTRFISKDRHALELYIPDATGREFKMLEIAYTRKPPEKQGAPASRSGA